MQVVDHGDRANAICSDVERDATISAFLPNVRAIARALHRRYPQTEFDELVGDGALGLVVAYERFDPSCGMRLDVFFAMSVRGAMLNGIRKRDPVSERVRRCISSGRRFADGFAASHGTMPTDATIDAAVPGYRNACVRAHLTTPVYAPDETAMEMYGAFDVGGDPAEFLTTRDAHLDDTLALALAALTDHRRFIIEQHYFREQALSTISAAMGVRPGAVYDTHRRALNALRKTMALAS
jgi:RNA polymerase sigma factor for flagellar operon FliA